MVRISYVSFILYTTSQRSWEAWVIGIDIYVGGGHKNKNYKNRGVLLTLQRFSSFMCQTAQKTAENSETLPLNHTSLGTGPRTVWGEFQKTTQIFLVSTKQILIQ